MTLKNLLAINRLQEHQTDAVSVARLLAAATRNLADAQVTAISPDSRFDAAYKCVMQCAMLGLWANGYRTTTSQSGHHQTAIQSLPLTMACDKATTIVLDGLRKQRNLGDYVGESVSAAVLASAIDEATKLLAHTRTWLRASRPELVPDG